MHLALALMWLLQADPQALGARALRGMYTLVDGKDEDCTQVDADLANELADQGQCFQAGYRAVRCNGTPHRLMFRTRYQCELEQKKRW